MTTPSRLRLAFALGLFLIGACSQARAADAAGPTYAVLSLVGDQFTIVGRQMATGSHLDRNSQMPIAVDDAAFDAVATTAAESAIARALPGTATLRVSIRDPRLFALQERLFTDTADSKAMREALREVLVKSGATHLLVIVKRRDQARFALRDGSVGTGTIAGLGFYVDDSMRTVRTETGEHSQGFIAPYAYVTVALIEVATMRALGSKSVSESSMVTPADSKEAVVAWDALSAEAKVVALNKVVSRAVSAAASDLLAR